eukprot:TRINITY_DN123_c0_g1_i1.p1 TRINITY_DN123_c0_g1~~TRINITY_DN123_c0_g1_i1.p1  ORF type:complete len:179 (+),score=30.74 TRINITY_DN123_c0_g1_i1:891-1427(+)
MNRIQFALCLAALAVISPAALAQMCYVTVATESGWTQCQSPPLFTIVWMLEDPVCSYQICFPQNYPDDELGEQNQWYLRSEEDIPLPLNYVRVKYYSNDQCTSEVTFQTTEYYAIGNCTNVSMFTASCNESEARIQRYSDLGCNVATISDDTYPLNQCTLGSGGYVRASCGSGAPSAA